MSKSFCESDLVIKDRLTVLEAIYYVFKYNYNIYLLFQKLIIIIK